MSLRLKGKAAGLGFKRVLDGSCSVVGGLPPPSAFNSGPEDVNNMQKVLVEKYGFKVEAGFPFARSSRARKQERRRKERLLLPQPEPLIHLNSMLWVELPEDQQDIMMINEDQDKPLGSTSSKASKKEGAGSSSIRS